VDPGTFLAQLAATDGDPVDHITRQEDIERVQAAARGLPGAQQQALVLAACLGRTAAEISRIEQIPLGTAKTRIRSAILKLRAALSEQAGLP
jgi:RNA polymerase sigma-70 factor (ECF subfamily)